jgi:hypothetical protein
LAIKANRFVLLPISIRKSKRIFLNGTKRGTNPNNTS